MTIPFPLVLVSLLALSACSSRTPSATPDAAPGSAPGGVVAGLPVAGTGDATADDVGTCDAAAAQAMVGTLATPAVVEQARVAAGARSARTLSPGQYTTMEFNVGRLNLAVDDRKSIIRVYCG